MDKPSIGIYGLTGCAGDQLAILNCEDELLDIAGSLDIKFFPMATSANDEECSLDIVFVEGSVVQLDFYFLDADVIRGRAGYRDRAGDRLVVRGRVDGDGADHGRYVLTMDRSETIEWQGLTIEVITIVDWLLF